MINSFVFIFHSTLTKAINHHHTIYLKGHFCNSIFSLKPHFSKNQIKYTSQTLIILNSLVAGFKTGSLRTKYQNLEQQKEHSSFKTTPYIKQYPNNNNKDCYSGFPINYQSRAVDFQYWTILNKLVYRLSPVLFLWIIKSCFLFAFCNCGRTYWNT